MGRVICVTGMPGCGKEEFVKVAEQRGLAIVRMGDIVREEAKRRGLKFSDETVGGMAHEERVKNGFGVWAERTVPHITDRPTVIDGIRGREEVEVFRRAFGDRLAVVAIHASPKVRYERIRKRGRGDDVISLEEFRRREERELGWGLGEVIATADFTVVNEDGLEGMQAECRRVLDAIGK
ncbi:MAG TPA: AAA family ATPase [Thermoplasmata archaeon]|nr:AAA family ATPase [Thermoplasmata archaeon]